MARPACATLLFLLLSPAAAFFGPQARHALPSGLARGGASRRCVVSASSAPEQKKAAAEPTTNTNDPPLPFSMVAKQSPLDQFSAPASDSQIVSFEDAPPVAGDGIAYTDITIGVVAEGNAGENRVAQSPESAGLLTSAGFNVVVERGAGKRAGFSDAEYEAAGCVVDSFAVAWQASSATYYLTTSPRGARIASEFPSRHRCSLQHSM